MNTEARALDVIEHLIKSWEHDWMVALREQDLTRAEHCKASVNALEYARQRIAATVAA